MTINHSEINIAKSMLNYQLC